jgi:hypothetical protein
MTITFLFSSGEYINIRHETLTAEYLKFYSVAIACLKKIEAYGLSSDILKNEISYYYENFFNSPDIQNLSNTKIRELKTAINDFVNQYNGDDENIVILKNYFNTTVLNSIEPEVKRQYIIAKVNEAREANIPDPPVEISNDPVEIF